MAAHYNWGWQLTITEQQCMDCICEHSRSWTAYRNINFTGMTRLGDQQLVNRAVSLLCISHQQSATPQSRRRPGLQTIVNGLLSCNRIIMQRIPRASPPWTIDKNVQGSVLNPAETLCFASQVTFIYSAFNNIVSKQL